MMMAAVGRWVDSECESSYNLALGFCMPQTLKDTGVFLGRQVLLMRRTAERTHNADRRNSFFALNKHTYSASIENSEVPYRVMFVHLTTSNSIHAVDDLQSN
jgi:hypothetical protein